MLTYLSGVGANRQTKKTAKVKAKIERKELKQASRQQRLTSAGTFAATSAKKVASKTPAALVVQRIKKAKVEGQKRAAFKRAGEPLAVSPSEIFAEPQEIQNADIEFYQGEQEIDQPEFNNNDMQDDIGIIYPGYGAVKQAPKKKSAAKPAKKQVSPEVKAKRQAAVKKVSAQVMNVAKATLEAKGIKFPTKDQVEKQAEEMQPVEKKSNKMLYIIGGGALALFLILKKK